MLGGRSTGRGRSGREYPLSEGAGAAGAAGTGAEVTGAEVIEAEVAGAGASSRPIMGRDANVLFPPPDHGAWGGEDLILCGDRTIFTGGF